MQKGQALIFILVGILILTGIAGGAYYLGAKRSETFDEKLSRQNPVFFPSPGQTGHKPAPDTKPTDIIDETANLQTYTDKNVGFTFQYTINWEEKSDLSEIMSKIDFGTPVLSVTVLKPRPPRSTDDSMYDEIRIFIYKNINNLTVDEFVKREAFKNEITGDKWLDYGNYKRGVPYEFNGIEAIRVDQVMAPPGKRGDAVFIPKDKYVIGISATNPSESNEKILNQILFTFKFL